MELTDQNRAAIEITTRAEALALLDENRALMDGRWPRVTRAERERVYATLDAVIAFLRDELDGS